ncbi:hypothetical protein O6H91_22G061500 [Diphasiastrum complanatum]|uniref:Uncharacterized protein n=6 Tax=Diphasiastrum complanatum TaxID=34168 RepID=A0ACC2AGF7_DIPCM|nr:hypothetical protein O6H91_22G061500 [Diphasiastrum complanatum]KAJ7516527.1 hypothetical protein O6H91_22G061500 [Diphasiastrum complanatum]KAJ7516528.1 hypothetical protein O6H91_22G061500 [Diphasiastrum complanatum]KAJ7516530.1 hypothetical protein O6H91_22G061500 [Diphasiastrum complanatum]KAJ7516531.1 hypothetical protein O6H91_22G061500 [Diphasiastrum complanatum]
MAATSRVENDGTQYAHGGSNGHRGHVSNSLGSERPGFFRDTHEGRSQMLGGSSGGRGVSAGNTVSSHVELPPLSQVLVLEMISLGEQKFARQLELRRAINAAVGSSTDDPSLGSVQAKSLESLGIEELKRIKSSILDNISRARERSRHLAEAVVKLDKYCSVLQARKRSRSDAPVHERPLISLAAECPTSALTKANLSCAPGHLGPVDTTARPADKPKTVNINKRLRTSVAADVRVEGRVSNPSMPRSVSFSDREKEFLKPNGSVSSTMEDKGRLSASPGEHWEKSKLKGRRSGIKQDISVPIVAAGALEGEREHKWSGQHRLSQDGRTRVNEGHGLRSGPVHGITSTHKAEATLHMNGSALRPVSKGETDNIVSTADRTERPLGTDKERSLPKSVGKSSLQEEVHSLSPTAITKGKAARAPRSNSLAPGNFAHLARVASFGDREKPSVTSSKVQVASGQTNRKRPAPSRSSSPPVAQWVGQRPQKIARVARRVNIMPPVGLPSNDDVANGLSDGNVNRDGAIVGPRSNMGTVSGSGVARRLPASGMASPKQSKPRSERVNSSLIVSESEESEEATDGRLKEKLKKHGDWETKPPPTVQNFGNVVFPAKKMQVEMKEDVGDGVRRQGRSGRTPGAPKPLHVVMPIEEIDVPTTAKQLRSTKVGIEKPERVGRAIVKNRTLDRKPLTRPRRPPGNSAGELSGESDDDRDELINAVQAATSASALACSSEFWKKMEPYFAYLKADDMSFLRNQVDLKWNAMSSYSPSTEAPGKLLPFANGNIESDGGFGRGASKSTSSEDLHTGGKPKPTAGCLEKAFPLSQRLLAALISEQDIQDNCRHVEEARHDNVVQPFRDPFMSSKSAKYMNADYKSKNLEAVCDKNHHVENYGDSVKDESAIANGHGVCVYTDSFLVDSVDETDDIVVQVRPELTKRVGKYATDDCHGSGVHTESPTGEDGDCGNKCSAIFKPGMMAWELQCEAMTLDDRILMELQSIGLTVEQVPDLAQTEQEDIGVEMSKMKRELNDQVCSNKQRIQALEHTIMTRKEAEERDREILAMMKLVEIAYNKRKGCRGGASSNIGIKSSGPKGARAAATAFTKRTLTRLRKFEAGQSCFTDATLRGILFSNTSRESEGTEVAHNTLKGEESGTLTVRDATSSKITIQEKGPLTASEGAGRLDAKERLAMESERNPPEVPSANRSKGKDVVSMRDVSTLGSTVFGGTKGKRSERDRDGKSQGKEMITKNQSDGRSRNATGNIKGERKTKTKPRQKTAPLFKAINGLLGMPAEVPRDVSSVPTFVQDRVEKNVNKKDEVQINTAVDTQESSISGTIDLSQLQIPDDLGIHDGLGPNQDLNSWFGDFDDPNQEDGQGELSMIGLSVPMDDLSDLRF